MYASGDINNFASRLHQLPTGHIDLMTGFLIEGRSYTGINPFYQNDKWNREFNLKKYQFGESGTFTGRWFY